MIAMWQKLGRLYSATPNPAMRIDVLVPSIVNKSECHLLGILEMRGCDDSSIMTSSAWYPYPSKVVMRRGKSIDGKVYLRL